MSWPILRIWAQIGSFMVNFFYRANNRDIQPFIVYYSSFTAGDSTYKNKSAAGKGYQVLVRKSQRKLKI